MKRNWCVLGLSNIWSNRGRWVSIIEICVPYTKMPTSQHSRTTFKPNFTYIFLSVRAVSKNTVWVGWPCTFMTFLKSFYHELSRFVPYFMLMLHIELPEVQRHWPLAVKSWKMRFSCITKVRKQGRNFTRGSMRIQTQLFLHKMGLTNKLRVIFQVHPGALKV